jgi:predicted DNA binding CopG/RHH family protein
MPKPLDPPISEPISVRFPEAVLQAIKEAAEVAGMPYTIFIRVAAKREAERLLKRRAA